MPQTLLKIDNLTVNYVTHERRVEAVNSLSLSIAKGEVVALVGETGAGKTTLALSILGLLPKPTGRIEGGSIFLEETEITNASERLYKKIRGKKISMIFQDPMSSLDPVRSVGDQIQEVIRLHSKLSRVDSIVRVKELLDLVGLSGDRYDHYPHEFSGGMRQRIVIAIALACSPELLIADEPTTALDVTIQAQVLELIRKIQKQYGTSVLLITHDMGVVAKMCSKVAVMYAGNIVEYGSLEDIFDHRCHPYTVGLFNALPSLTDNVRRLCPIKGTMPDPASLPQGCTFSDRCPHVFDRCQKERPGAYEVSNGHLVYCFRCEEKEGVNDCYADSN